MFILGFKDDGDKRAIERETKLILFILDLFPKQGAYVKHNNSYNKVFKVTVKLYSGMKKSSEKAKKMGETHFFEFPVLPIIH